MVLNNHRQAIDAATSDMTVKRKQVSGQPNLVPRRRDRWNNRQGAYAPITQPQISNRPVAETSLDAALTVVEQRFPARANFLRFRHDEERLNMQKMSRDVGEREEQLQERINEKARAHNAKITDRITVIRNVAQVEIARLKLEADGAKKRHLTAEVEAAENLAAIGMPYNPKDCTEQAIIRKSGATPKSVAVAMGLPSPGGLDNIYMPVWISTFCSVVVGFLVGLSLLIVTHVLRPDTIARHPDLAAVGTVIGYGIALAGKFACRLSWLRVGQYYVLPCSRARLIRAIITAIGISAAIGGSDMPLEMRGLLAIANLQTRMDSIGKLSTAGDQHGGYLLFLCIAFVVSGAYIVTSSLEGYLKGRDCEVQCKAVGTIDKADSEFAATQRSDVKVCAAQHSLSLVRLYREQIERVADQIAKVHADAEQAVATLEASKLPEDAPIREEGKLLVEDSVDEAKAAGILWYEAFETVLDVVEPIPSSRILRPSTWIRRFIRRPRYAK